VVLFEWVECSNWGWWTVGARKNQIWASRVDRADQGRVLRPYIGKGSGRGDSPSIGQRWRGKTAPSETCGCGTQEKSARRSEFGILRVGLGI
jgi:hypothetical protein